MKRAELLQILKKLRDSVSLDPKVKERIKKELLATSQKKKAV